MKDRMIEDGRLDHRSTFFIADGASYHASGKTIAMAIALGLRLIINTGYCPEINFAERFINCHKALAAKSLRDHVHHGIEKKGQALSPELMRATAELVKPATFEHIVHSGLRDLAGIIAVD